MKQPISNRVDPATTITSLIPYAHVTDVKRSLAFYALLGMSVRSTHATPEGRTVWANAESGEARLMLALASDKIAADQQAVLLYMHCADVAGLRTRLLAEGLHDGGTYCGQHGPNSNRLVVFEVAYPFYMPAGELRVHDPDGYVLLIGQLA